MSAFLLIPETGDSWIAARSAKTLTTLNSTPRRHSLTCVQKEPLLNMLGARGPWTPCPSTYSTICNHLQHLFILFQRGVQKCFCPLKFFVHTSFKILYLFLFVFCVLVCLCQVIWALWFSSSALSTALTGGLLNVIFLSHVRKPQDS